jgi:hypothetical protein
VVADEKDPPVPELLHQLMDVLGHRPLVVTSGRPLGIARAPQIGHDHRVALRQLWHDVAPPRTRSRLRVEQHDRIALSGQDVVEPHPG